MLDGMTVGRDPGADHGDTMTVHAPASSGPARERILVYGASGLVGGQLLPILSAQENVEIIAAQARIESALDVINELDRVRPSRVVHAAGLTGRPNVDWCDSHVVETTRVNCYGTLNVIDACFARGIHVTYFSTGV